MWLSLILPACVCSIVYSQENPPIVNTIYGSLEGFSTLDYFNRSYDVFLGIPYSIPPINERRWTHPEPMEPWEGIRNATEWTDHCIQSIAPFYPIAGFSGNESEDCLHLNVYIPQSLDYALGNQRPVMVYYFGGGFQFGTAEMYPGEIIANTGDVIVVNINYRVSTMGFLSTGDEVLPGNWGLWDAKMALQWVIDNIQAFGGDPNMITIFGQSAGGGLVTHFMLSQQTNMMFQRAIAISGNPLAFNSTNDTVLYMSEVFECNTTDSQEIVDCLRLIEGKTLDRQLKKASRRDGVILQLGVFEDREAEQVFVDQDVRKSWKEGRGSHLDFITGSTIHDSAGFITGKVLGIPAINETNDYNKDNKELFNYFFVSYRRYDNTLEILDALYNQFPEMNSTDDAVASEVCTRVQTDISFGAPSFYQGEKHAESGGDGSTYLYLFSHRNSFQDGRPSWTNGSHLDDVYELLGPNFLQDVREALLGEFDQEEYVLSDLIMKYYANFAHTGDPSQGPHTVGLIWPQYDIASRQYLLQTPTPIIEVHTQEIQDRYNWFLYDFQGLTKPEWGTPLQFGQWENPEEIMSFIDNEDYDYY